MKHEFVNKDGIGSLIMQYGEPSISKNYFQDQTHKRYYSIAWNTGNDQIIRIDEVFYRFESNAVLPIMLNQSFDFEHAESIVMWRFNREFYCVLTQDPVVSCVGFIFYGPSPTMFVNLDEEHLIRLQGLLAIFREEFDSKEDVKDEMLRMLLVRLIIIITRLAKRQHLGNEDLPDDKYNLIRQFCVLVEKHFRQEHQLAFYANLLNKSPKTISNHFSLYSKKKPTQIIQDRIILEARRLFYYTDKSVKEIAFDLGFEDVGHFSKFFKKATNHNPSEIKKITRLFTDK